MLAAALACASGFAPGAGLKLVDTDTLAGGALWLGSFPSDRLAIVRPSSPEQP